MFYAATLPSATYVVTAVAGSGTAVTLESPPMRIEVDQEMPAIRVQLAAPGSPF
jgi:hypothetical protein